MYRLFMFLSVFLSLSPLYAQNLLCREALQPEAHSQGENLSSKFSQLSKKYTVSDFLKLGFTRTDLVKLRKQIQDISVKINSYESEKLREFFWDQLYKFKKKLNSSKSRNQQSRFNQPPSEWANEPWAYTYVDLMNGTLATPGTFNSFIRVLDYYKELGIHNLYLLPHYESPMQDGGYDPINHLQVRKSLGGNKDFQKFISIAKSKGFRIMLDFIPGHLSEQSSLFQNALTGDKESIDFFIHAKGKIRYKTITTESGEILNEYDFPDGKVLKSFVEFPDISQNHFHEYLIDGQIYSFYSSFYPFQKDLNNQNAKVINHHLNTLGELILQGADGIRADAISYWIKYPGSNGKNLPESLALAEYFNLFLKALNPNILFAPESVTSAEQVAKLQGQQRNMFGTDFGSISNGMFSFEEAQSIKTSFLFGDFTSWFQFEKRKEKIHRTVGTRNLLPLHKHDEWELGFNTSDRRKQFANHMFVFKNGYSGGARLASVLPVEKLKNYFKFMLALEGAPMIYYGDELGVKNSWPYAWRKSFERIRLLHELKVIDDLDYSRFQDLVQIFQSDPKNIENPPQSNNPLSRFIDARDIHRGFIAPGQLEDALKGKNETFNYLKKLLQIRNSNPLLNSDKTETALETYDFETAAFLRTGSKLNSNEQVLVLANNSYIAKKIRIDLNQYNFSSKKSLIEIELGIQIPFFIVNHGLEHYLEVEVPASSVYWLKSSE